MYRVSGRSGTLSVTDRVLPNLIDVRHSGALSRLYRLTGQRTSATMVSTKLSQALAVTQPAAATYRRLLELGRCSESRRSGTPDASSRREHSLPRINESRLRPNLPPPTDSGRCVRKPTLPGPS
jgi:hypothetical protein